MSCMRVLRYVCLCLISLQDQTLESVKNWLQYETVVNRCNEFVQNEVLLWVTRKEAASSTALVVNPSQEHTAAKVLFC